MSTQCLSTRHYSAIASTFLVFMGDAQKRNSIWPLVSHIKDRSVLSVTEHIEKIVRHMYAVNCLAYEIDNKEFCKPVKFVFEPNLTLTDVQLFKALESWRWNSMYTLEGSDQILSIPEPMGKSMYLAVDILHHLAETIAKRNPAYERAAWTL